MPIWWSPQAHHPTKAEVLEQELSKHSSFQRNATLLKYSRPPEQVPMKVQALVGSTILMYHRTTNRRVMPPVHAGWSHAGLGCPTRALSSPCFLFFRPLINASSGVRVYGRDLTFSSPIWSYMARMLHQWWASST